MNRFTLVKSFTLITGFLILWIIILVVAGITSQTAQANSQLQQNTQVPRGGQLYDKWYAVLGVNPPGGNMPIWSRQTTNTSGGPDTWRCVTCHGWDYQGKDGAYRAGSNFTGFPGLLQTVQPKSSEEIIETLKGKNDPAHDFSGYLDDASLNDLAEFLKTGLINDNEFIDPVSLEVKGGDQANGKQLFDQRCSKCHGADGITIRFRFEGIDATLGTLARLDPWRFLHKTRYGTPGTQMPIGFDLGWTAQEGRDVLLYAQGLPSGLEPSGVGPAIIERLGTEVKKFSGPASSFITGLLTAFGAMAVSLGFAILLGGALIGIIFILVWLIRGRR